MAASSAPTETGDRSPDQEARSRGIVYRMAIAMASSPAFRGSSTASREAVAAADRGGPSFAWQTVVAAAYVFLLVLWFAENYRVLPGPHLLERDLGGVLVNAVAPAIVGLVSRSWRALALPLSSLVIAAPLALAGADGRGADPLGPVAAALLISVLFGVPAVAIGRAIRQLVTAPKRRAKR